MTASCFSFNHQYLLHRIFTDELLQNHKSNFEQLIYRDRNHPSVVMWSIANEPKSGQSNADSYFKEVVGYMRELDASRPITASIDVSYEQDQAAKYLDIISFNRFNAWNSNTGRLDTITSNVVNEAKAWHEVSCRIQRDDQIIR